MDGQPLPAPEPLGGDFGDRTIGDRDCIMRAPLPHLATAVALFLLLPACGGESGDFFQDDLFKDTGDCSE